MTSDPKRGLVILNTGDGKGKSTAAFGVMLRAVARGWRVIVIQFIKSDKWKTGRAEDGRAARSRLDSGWRRFHMGIR